MSDPRASVTVSARIAVAIASVLLIVLLAYEAIDAMGMLP